MAGSILAEVKYRDVEGFDGYRVGNDGSVWTCRINGRPKGTPLYASGFGGVDRSRWRRLRPCEQSSGHVHVTLRRDGKSHHRQIHRLVLEAFKGPCPDGMEGCHEDGNPRNNEVGNLRWGTHKSNGEDMVRHGRTNQGTRYPKAKLNDAMVRQIFEWSASGETQTTIANRLEVSRRAIGMVLRREIWKHVAIAG